MANQGKRMVSEDQIKKLENLADIRTAGENITIENGVISAQSGGTEYTAGNGIEITEANVINNTAPGSTLYEHNISVYYYSTDEKIRIAIKIINSSNTAFTTTNLYNFLNTNSFRYDTIYEATGFQIKASSSDYLIISGVFVDPENQPNKIYIARAGIVFASSLMTFANDVLDFTNYTFTDTIREI